MDKTVSAIINKIDYGKDCIVFSPVYQPGDLLFRMLRTSIKGNVVCVVPNTLMIVPDEKTFVIHGAMNERTCEMILLKCEKVYPYTLFLTPTVLQRDSVLHFLQFSPPVVIFVIDGDCASVFHFSFSKVYRYIGDIRCQLSEKIPLCIFSADDNTKNIREFKNVFSLTVPAMFYPGLTHLRQTITACKTDLPVAVLEKYVRVNKVIKMLVFCTTRQTCEDAGCYFSFFNYPCASVHGGISAEERNNRINSFNQNQHFILFTTWMFNEIRMEDTDRIGFLGLPADMYQLYHYTCQCHADIPVIYNSTDENEAVNHIYEDADIRSLYSVFNRDTILEERKYRYALMMHFLNNGSCLFGALQKMNGDIFYERDIKI